MGKGNSIYAMKAGPNGSWKRVASFTQSDLQSVTTYVVSPKGDKVILISPVKPTLHQAIRDSIQAGRPLHDVVVAYRNAGTREIGNYDVSEGGLLTLAEEQMKRSRSADGLEMFRYTAELFPKSYEIPLELGAALRKSGDEKGALDAYRRSITLNSRATADDKAAADAAEKAIAELSHN